MFIVKTSAAQMPSSCKGRYRRVAVLETDGTIPTMISKHAKGVVQVVETWERLSVGKTDRCACQRALKEAEELAAKLNGERS